ncbi:MAG TPA: peroxiredoxin [Steroidobacteraceae bacterium]|nr:peroxiredoxin [Steroidobacteraceae bacterium]
MKTKVVLSWLGGAIGVVAALGAYAALETGVKAPDFSAKAALNGKEFTYSLADNLKKGPVVVYFYPSAYTGGCNLQAHTFSTKTDQFAAAGASIVGVSLDDIGRLKDFSSDPEYCAGKIPVASDADGSIAKSYGLKVGDANPAAKDTRGVQIKHGFAERTTFIVNKDGTIAATVGGVSPVDNVNEALAAVQKLSGAKK